MSTSRESAWLVLPRDPLIFRDGRPFDAVSGARARTLPFPFPTTLAGALRTLEGFQKHGGKFDEETVHRLLQRHILGPYLAELNPDGALKNWFVPAPQDALWVKQENRVRRFWLRPLSLEGPLKSVQSPFPDGLSPVGPSVRVKEKPYRESPAFWRWEAFRTWLIHPEDGDADPSSVGIRALPQESRTHVHIDPGTQTAREGFLFHTTGLRFLHIPPDQRWGGIRTLGLLVQTDAELEEGIGFLGGERRAVRWERTSWEVPEIPEEVLDSAEKGAVRMILLTPAAFQEGYRPAWVFSALADVKAKMVGVALSQRPAFLTGWDMKEQREKPSRRLAPAGTVYYLHLEGPAEACRRFVKTLWFQSISDDEQDRRDGLGQVAFGVWSGQLEEVDNG